MKVRTSIIGLVSSLLFAVSAQAQVATIQPVAALPVIADPIVLDGSTALGFAGTPVIELDGTNAGLAVLELVAGSENSQIVSLVINRATGDAIDINGVDGVIVLGNRLGTDATGTLDMGNFCGIRVSNADGTILGGTNAGDGNLVSGNTYGIIVQNASTNTSILGNIVGLNAAGDTAIGNIPSGISVNSDGLGNVIGGAVVGARNVVSGNNSGITITGSNVTVLGNYVGTDIDGTSAIPNVSGGIALDASATDNTIGGTSPEAANLVSGNGGSGIEIGSLETTRNVVIGNVIGLDRTGTVALPNPIGVKFEDNAHDNRVGGIAAGEGNKISGNSWLGVSLNSFTGSGNAILGNSILDNGSLGIDLSEDGVTENDADDDDPGPNGHLNFPEISSATVTGGIISLNGEFDVPAGNYRFEFFLNPSGADPSGNGEGETWVGSASLSHSGNGEEPFGAAFPGGLGDVVTATVTEDLGGGTFGSTSEFSDAVVAVAPRAISGIVFEDSDFDGTPLNWDGGSGDLALANVDVELYDAADSYIASTTTAVDGSFTFTNVPDGNTFKVRARSETIGDWDTAPAGGLNATVPASWPYPLAEMTWADDAALLGGQDPARDDTETGDDAGPGDTWVAVTVSGGDATDVNLGFAYNLITHTADDGLADANRSAQGSLRQFLKNANAIGSAAGTTANNSQFHLQTAANQVDGTDTWWRLAPTAPLPMLDDGNTVIDGSTQRLNSGIDSNTRGPEIEIHGLAVTGDGLYMDNVPGNTVRELVINGFDGLGIVVTGASASNNAVYGCYIGTDAVGESAIANSSMGVWITTGASFITIGGSAAGEGNLISGNGDQSTEGGVSVGISTSEITFLGNRIGVDRTGTNPLPNAGPGISLSGGVGIVVGGGSAGEGNILAANGSNGIRAVNWVQNLTVKGNRIGVGATGQETNLGNGSEGLNLASHYDDTNFVIGGLGAGEGNIIAYNGANGIRSSGTGTGDRIEGNLIGSNASNGIQSVTDGVVIAGNTITRNGFGRAAILLQNDVGSSQNNNLVFHNTIYNSGGAGIEVDGLGAVVRNNIITGSDGYGINVTTGTMTESNNLVTDATTNPPNSAGQSNVALDATDLNFDPLFTDAAGGDFSLTECSSPAINAGLDLGVDQPDLNGPAAGLFTGPGPDMGALESSCVTVATQIAGLVFEDVDFAGTASPWDGGSVDVAQPNVDVELYTISDTYVTSVTTDASGNFSFTNVTAGNYKLRVRSATIGDADTPPAGGLNGDVPATWPYPLPEMTWGHGAAMLGGQDPAVDDGATGNDSGPGDTYVAVTVSGSDVTGVQLGFTYNLIVNTNDDGLVENLRSSQGSLRQFLKNSNAIMSVENSFFDIPVTDPGYDGGGNFWSIQPALTALPTIVDPVIFDGYTQAGASPGTQAFPNAFDTVLKIELDGIQLGGAGEPGLTVSAANCTVRGLAINRFTGNGLVVSGAGTSGNTITGNFIGTDITGTVDLGNTVYGIAVNTGASGNTIGGTTAGARNLISGNESHGIYLRDSGTTGNFIQGNYIGLDATGTAALGNSSGIYGVAGANGNTIGGDVAGAGNVLSGNTNGMYLGLDNTTIQGNLVGTNAAGTGAIPNSNHGIYITGSNNTIGGITVTAGNVVSGNSQTGILIANSGVTGNLVQGNFVGTDVFGTGPLANLYGGIRIGSSAADNTIGGTVPEAANIVAHNGRDGVALAFNAGTGNQILGNAIYDNVALGIDLNDNQDNVVEINDPGDIDSGPNGLQNYPDLTTAITDAATTITISGSINSTPSTTYRVEFFTNAAADASGYGEGAGFLGSADITTDTNGDATFTEPFSTLVTLGTFVSATATDPGGNTSEFSANVVASAPPSFEITGTVFEDVDFAGTAAEWDNGTVDAAQPGVDVELYDAGDAFLATTVTDASGVFTFTGLGDGNYKVRARSATLGDAATPPAGGLNPTVPGTWPNPLPEMTWAHGAARIGGQDPAVDDTDTADDSGPGDTWVSVTVSGGSVPGVNLGFAYNVVSNTLDDGAANASRSGQGSLRQFLKNSNAITGVETTYFDLPVSDPGYNSGGGFWSIQPTLTALPEIADPSIVDGYTQAGASPATQAFPNPFDAVLKIEIDGTLLAGSGESGLTTSAGNSTIRGLAINRFSGAGAHGVAVVSGGSNTIQGTFIGTDVNGSASLGNTEFGLRVETGNNRIGGTSAGEGNLISGNGSGGVVLTGSSATLNLVEGNFIGLDATGTSDLGNTQDGVNIQAGANGNTIGGTAVGAGNVISGNGGEGVAVSDAGTDNNVIQGNLIGTDVSGTVTVLNDSDGVRVANAAVGNRIGGTAAEARNIISGNGARGILIGSADGTIVEGNYIGVDIGGAGPLGNNYRGIEIGGTSSGNTIGGTAAGSGNIVAHNTSNGIVVLDTAVDNRLQGNAVHDNTAQDIDLGNDGVDTNDAGDGDTGPNQYQNYPVLTMAATSGASPIRIEGTLNSAANSAFRIEFFANTNVGSGGTSGAWNYIGSTDVTTDPGGNASFNETVAATVPVGGYLCAIATDPTGNSSEFSAYLTTTPVADHSIIVDTVDDTVDGDDSSIAALIADPGFDGMISLREAINASNNTANDGGPDLIHFDIAGPGPHVIEPAGVLPTVSDPVVIDGSSEPDFVNTPIIVLSGSLAGVGTSGLSITAGSSTVRGLVIHSFDVSGIRLENLGGNTIVGNFIGLDPTGLVGEVGNNDEGIFIYQSPSNVIGGTDPADRNIITGNRLRGIAVDDNSDGPAETSVGNQIIGNYIGTDVTGTTRLPFDNGGTIFQQIGIYLLDGVDTEVGGVTPGEGNVLSGNDWHAVYVWGPDGHGNLIKGNNFGLDAAGVSPIGNGWESASRAAIHLSNSPDNTIGGTEAGAMNEIAGNPYYGILAFGPSAVQNRILGNSIHDNGAMGIDLGLDGVTANDADDSDVGPNNLQNFPVLLSANTDGSSNLTVTGGISSAPLTDYRIEFFSSPAADGSGNGEGETYLGFVDRTTNGSGTQTFNVDLPVAIPVGHWISATATSPTGDTSEFAESIEALGASDLQLAKVVDIGDPNEGDTVTYTVTVSNAGPNDGTGIEVTDLLPAGVTYVSDTPSQGSYVAGTGIWTVGDVVNSGTATLTLVATVDAGTAGTNVTNNAAIIAADQTDPVAANNTASAVIGVSSADLQITKVVDNNAPNEGDTVTYTVTVSNAGPNDGTGIEVTDLLPAGVTYVSDTPSQGSYVAGTGIWTVGDVVNAGTATLSLVATVDAGTAGTNVTNNAAITAADQTDPVAANNTASAVIGVSSADLQIAKVVDNNAPNEGDTVTYTVTVTNAGPNDGTGISVTDLLPAGVTYVSDTPSQGAYVAGTGVWTVGDVANSGTATLTLVATVDAGTAGTNVTNNAAITAADQTDPVAANNTASAVIGVSSADLQITKVVDNNAPNEGDTVSYTVTVTNAGPNDGTGIEVTDLLPTGVTYVSDTPSQGTYVSGTGIWTVGNLANSGNATLALVATVDAGTAGTNVTNNAAITGANQADPVAANNTASAVIGVSSADLQITKVVDNNAPNEGDTVSYTVTVTNAGPNDGTGIEVTDLLPAGLTYVSDTPSQGTYTAGTGVWTVGDVANAGTAGLTLVATVDAGTGGSTITNNAAITAADQADPVMANNTALAGIDVQTNIIPVIQITTVPLELRPILPGAAADDVLRLELVNQGAQSETMESLTVTNQTVGSGTAVQLDADWQLLSLLVDTNGSLDTPNTTSPDAVTSGAFSGSRLDFHGLAITLAPGETVALVVQGQASLGATDGDILKVAVEETADIIYSGSSVNDAAWPLSSAGGLAVDGMVADQLAMQSVDPALFVVGSNRNLALDIVLPANGYEADQLHRLNIINTGTASDLADIDKLECWADEGDGLFDPATDTLMGELEFTGSRYELTGLNLAIPLSGQRVFISADIAETAQEGQTLQLGLPSQLDVGVGMDSGNDGPIDRQVVNPYAQVVSTADRVILSAGAIVPGTVAPGETDVPLMHLVALNSYATDRRLVSVTVSNGTVPMGAASVSELDGELDYLKLRIDGNGDGILGDLEDDPVLATGTFQAGTATFSGLVWNLAAGATSHLFLTGDVSLAGAADLDVISANVASGVDLTFENDVVLSANWPLDSGARWTVDGMVAAQVGNTPAPSLTLAAGEGPVLVMDLELNANGYVDDVLTGLKLVNRGTATENDIADLRLWRDGGDGLFSGGGGDDVELGPFVWVADTWLSPVLNTALPIGGTRLYVGLTVSPNPTNSTTVRMAVPVDGITVTSDNDGPVDQSVEGEGTFLLSTAPLLAELRFDQEVSTVGQTVTAKMLVRNVGTESMLNISPSALVPGGNGTLMPAGGPTPASFDLAPGADDSFTWSFTATSTGMVTLSGLAEGVGEISSQDWPSVTSTSGPHEILEPVTNLELFAVANMPFTINRGQTDVVPLTLTFVNPGGESRSDALIHSLRIRLQDDQGMGIVPDALLSRVVINEGGETYLEKETLEGSGNEIDLTLDSPVRVTSLEPVTLGIRLDVRADATVPAFVVEIGNADWFGATGAISNNPVPIFLQDAVYPIQSGLVSLLFEATQLNVAAAPAAWQQVGEGQPGVDLMTLQLLNPGQSGSGSDIRISSLSFALTDTLGVPIPTPSIYLDRLRLENSLQTLLEVSVADHDSTVFTLELSSPITVPVDTPLELAIVADIATSAAGAVRLNLADAALLQALDGNSGQAVPVVYASDPVAGGPVVVQLAATSIMARGTPRLPSDLVIGTLQVTALDISLRHPGVGNEAAIQVESFLVNCRNEDRDPVPPAGVIDALEILRDGTPIGNIGNPGGDGDILIPVSGLELQPGQTIDLTLRLNLEASASPGSLELVIAGVGIHAIDSNLGVLVPAHPESGDEFPLTSGLTRLQESADELRVDFASLMPAVLVESPDEIPVAKVVLRNPNSGGVSGISVSSLTLRAADNLFRVVPVGEAAEEILLYQGENLWARSGVLTPADTVAVLQPAAAEFIGPAQDVDLEVAVLLRSPHSVNAFRLGLDEDDVAVVQPTGSLVTVRVEPEAGQFFPYWTEMGSFSGASLAASYSNFPNPFAAGQEQTTFVFSLEQPATVSLRLLTAHARPVQTLITEEYRPAGLYQEDKWDGRNGNGVVIQNGVYVAELTVVYQDGTKDRQLRKVAIVR